MPDVVNNIVWCHQLETKANNIVVTAEHLLGELAGFDRFQGETNELKDELRAYQREQVDSWSRQVLAAIDHPSEPLGKLHCWQCGIVNDVHVTVYLN